MLAGVLPGLVASSNNPDALTVTPLLHGGGESAGVFRVSGNAQDQEGDNAWSIILKVLAAASPQESDRWNFAQREYHAYGSAVLREAEGVAMPRCLGRVRRPDGSTWLWLEDVADDGDWPLSRYQLAAYHLGRFNGDFAQTRAGSSEPWLSRRWLRGWLEEAGPSIARLQELRDDPIIQPVYSDADAVLHLWSERDRRLNLLEGFPQTLCHLDVHRRNMISRPHDAGDQTLLIDWAFVGMAALGEELAALVSATIAYGDVQVGDIGELESTVFQGYLAGLRDAGYRANPEQVWAAYSLAASLRLPVGAVRLVLPLLMEPSLHEREQQQHDRPLAELFARWEAMNGHLIALGDSVAT
ncbi:hypothetical protein RKD54_001668 [Pseudarthrobacter sp. SLBN-100]